MSSKYRRQSKTIAGRAKATASPRRKARKRPNFFLWVVNRLLLLAALVALLRWWLENREAEEAPSTRLEADEGIPLDRFAPRATTAAQPMTAPVEVPSPSGTEAIWPDPEVTLSQAETAPVAPSTEPQTAEAAEAHPAEEAMPETSPSSTTAPVSAAAGAPAEAATPRPDDLTAIEGIGPKISAQLRSFGITTYRQLADTEASRIEEILRQAGLRLADPATWPEQARLLAAGDMEGFQELLKQLKGGRRPEAG